MKIHFLLLGVAVLLAGCEPVRHYNRLQVAPLAGKLPKKPYGSVKVYQTTADIKAPYDVVAVMSCQAEAGDEAAVLNAMLYRAADLGADGVLLNSPRIGAEEVGGQRVNVQVGWMALVGDANARAYRAQAIRFKE